MIDAPRRLAAALLCLFAASGGCSAPVIEEIQSTASVTVRTEPATRGTIRAVVHAAGSVGPAPGADLLVVAPERARIVAIPHAGGERVRRGDVLVRFDIPSAAADVRRQQAEVTRAEANRDAADATRTRARELFDRGVAARRESEEATRSLADADAAVAQAQASLAAAQSVAGRSTVRATFDGVVVTRFHNAGDLVEAAANDPILRVVDLQRLEVVAAIPLSDVLRVEAGARAHLTSAGANTTDASLTVLSLPAAVDSGTATVSVRLGSVAPLHLPVGAPVQVAIDAEQHHDVVLVPAAAVVRDGEETAVFVVVDGKARRRAVQVGLTDGRAVEVVSGVEAGDRVIVDGQTGLPDAAAVTEAPGDASAAATGGAR